MAPTTMTERLLSEQRAVLEYGAFGVAWPWFSLLPRGEGQPVLVLPGFAGSDRSTVPLRSVLRNLGYDARGWGLGRNDGPHPEILDGMVSRLAGLAEASGQPVSLVGWSLGGVYARGLARHTPHRVRQVITLGSPFRATESGQGLSTPPVPVSAIYSKSDAIVPWRAAIEEDGPRRESIEVRGTHLGLGVNPAVVVAVADRLAQPLDGWKPFSPGPLVRHLFPRPEPVPT
jgi:pimeloyl-ACP methyl ester carboxylesterase